LDHREDFLRFDLVRVEKVANGYSNDRPDVWNPDHIYICDSGQFQYQTRDEDTPDSVLCYYSHIINSVECTLVRGDGQGKWSLIKVERNFRGRLILEVVL
jgi:hypothetical protein